MKLVTAAMKGANNGELASAPSLADSKTTDGAVSAIGAFASSMTGLTPEERFANHKAGVKDAGVVRRFGERLVPRLYAHLNPMTYDEAKEMEPRLAEDLRKKGYLVFGGH